MFLVTRTYGVDLCGPSSNSLPVNGWISVFLVLRVNLLIKLGWISQAMLVKPKQSLLNLFEVHVVMTVLMVSMVLKAMTVILLTRLLYVMDL
ncbi:hypothetical protein D3C72_1320530 [compost metagenome]